MEGKNLRKMLLSARLTGKNGNKDNIALSTHQSRAFSMILTTNSRLEALSTVSET